MNKQQTTNNKQQKIFTRIVNRLFMVDRSRQRGQTLIVIILALLVVSLIVLAVASRSITDVGISTTSEESARAFSAAEAGVEEAVEKIRSNPSLTSDNPPPQNLANNATMDYEITQQAGALGIAFLSPSDINSDMDTFQIYLATKGALTTGNYTGDNVCLLWGKPDPSNNIPDPVLEATVIYRRGGVWLNQRFGFDPQGTTRMGMPNPNMACNESVAAIDNNLGIDRTYEYSHQLSLTSLSPAPDTTCGSGSTRCVALLRLRLLQTQSVAQPVGIVPATGLPLPAQGFKISSTGTSGTTTRKVDVFTAFPAVPAIFDFAFYNDTGAVTK